MCLLKTKQLSLTNKVFNKYITISILQVYGQKKKN